MHQIKITLLFLYIVVFCEPMYCNTTSESKFIERDSTFEICKVNNISFSCHYVSSPNHEIYRFILEKEEHSAEIIFSNQEDHYELSEYTLSTTLCNYNTIKPLKIPYKEWLFFENVLSASISDLKRTDNQSYYFFDNVDYLDNPGPYHKFSYNIKEYSNNRQLTKVGKESCFFSDSFDFELGEGLPYGEWLIFKNPVMKSSENVVDHTFLEWENYCSDFAKETTFHYGKLKWTMSESELQCIFTPTEKQSFYFSVKSDSHLYISQIVQNDTDSESSIVHIFSPDGDISQIIISDKTVMVTFLYNEQGFLSSKITREGPNPDEVIRETFEIDKEYNKCIIERPDKN